MQLYNNGLYSNRCLFVVFRLTTCHLHRQTGIAFSLDWREIYGDPVSLKHIAAAECTRTDSDGLLLAVTA